MVLLHEWVFPGRKDTPPKPLGSVARDAAVGTAEGSGILMASRPWCTCWLDALLHWSSTGQLRCSHDVTSCLRN